MKDKIEFDKIFGEFRTSDETEIFFRDVSTNDILIDEIVAKIIGNNNKSGNIESKRLRLLSILYNVDEIATEFIETFEKRLRKQYNKVSLENRDIIYKEIKTYKVYESSYKMPESTKKKLLTQCLTFSIEFEKEYQKSYLKILTSGESIIEKVLRTYINNVILFDTREKEKVKEKEGDLTWNN